MEPGGINVNRTLPIDGALLSDVLLRLRRDADGTAIRWTLGDRGIAEFDVNFTTQGDTWITIARVWDATGLVLGQAAIHLRTTAPDEVTLSAQPTSLPPWWQERISELVELLHACVDELAEELLWHAARAGVGATS
jgi:hypothetical protein